MDNTSMSMNHALSSHLLDSFEQSRRAATPAFGTQPFDSIRHGYLPSAHGNLSQMSNLSQFSSAEQLAAMQAKLNKKLGPEFLSQRPGPGGGPKLTYAEGWKVINLANEVFGFNGWSSSVLSITTDYIDYNESTQRYNVGVSAVIRVTLRDGAFHEDVGFGALENAKGKGMALDKCKKEAVTDGIKRTLRNFGNVLGNCLYDKQYVSEITKVKAPVVKLDKDALHRRPDLAGPVPNMPAPSTAPQSSTSPPHNQLANTTTSRPAGNPSPLATSTPITNRALPHNLPTPDTSIEHADSSTVRPKPQQAARPNAPTTTRAPAPIASTSRVSPPAPATIPAAPASIQHVDSETNLFDGELAGELAADGSVYGSEDDAFFDNILPGELDMDVTEVPSVPARAESAQPTSEKHKSPAVQPGRKPTSGSNPESSTSARVAPVPSSATSNPEATTSIRPTRLRLADAIRGGPPGQKATAGDKRAAPPDLDGQKRQRLS
ncbi:DNA repair protein rad52 [Ceratobasidium sp. UAMH 11750]|nr:DNA repair protein rad52 [Ceratobasidium sp. UAMH 11750]